MHVKNIMRWFDDVGVGMRHAALLLTILIPCGYLAFRRAVFVSNRCVEVRMGGRLGNQMAALATALHEAIECGASCVELPDSTLAALAPVVLLPRILPVDHHASEARSSLPSRWIRRSCRRPCRDEGQSFVIRELRRRRTGSRALGCLPTQEALFPPWDAAKRLLARHVGPHLQPHLRAALATRNGSLFGWRVHAEDRTNHTHAQLVIHLRGLEILDQPFYLQPPCEHFAHIARSGFFGRPFTSVRVVTDSPQHPCPFPPSLGLSLPTIPCRCSS